MEFLPLLWFTSRKSQSRPGLYVLNDTAFLLPGPPTWLYLCVLPPPFLTDRLPLWTYLLFSCWIGCLLPGSGPEPGSSTQLQFGLICLLGRRMSLLLLALCAQCLLVPQAVPSGYQGRRPPHSQLPGSRLMSRLRIHGRAGPRNMFVLFCFFLKVPTQIWPSLTFQNPLRSYVNQVTDLLRTDWLMLWVPCWMMAIGRWAWFGGKSERDVKQCRWGGIHCS